MKSLIPGVVVLLAAPRMVAMLLLKPNPPMPPFRGAIVTIAQSGTR